MKDFIFVIDAFIVVFCFLGIIMGKEASDRFSFFVMGVIFILNMIY